MESFVCTPRKKRSRNFSADEENVIQSMVEVNWSLISEKHSSEVTRKRKNALWGEIVKEVNAKGVAPRSMMEVKEKWTNMNRKANKRYTDYRIQSRKTGGGPPPPELSQAINRIIDMMRDSASFDGVPDGLETECNGECEATLPIDTAAETVTFETDSVMAPTQTPAVDCSSQNPAVASTSQTPAVASTSQTPAVASTSQTTSVVPTQKRLRLSQSHVPTHRTQKEPSASEKVYELQQQVLSGELKLQELQTKKLLLQIKVLEKLECKEVHDEMTPTQMLLSLME